ncbi:MAG: permease-like cell division protein FtsX [Gudongella sp.]|nr:permease-like cell division protein FtsX [Gudongella sp.]
MRFLHNNTGYYLKEVKTLVRRDISSNLLSVISLAFIFFILALVFSLGLSSNFMITQIEEQAEISVYFEEDVNLNRLREDLLSIPGVTDVISVDAKTAKDEMTEVLGSDSRIVELFDHNPFSPYLDVAIQLDSVDEISKKAASLEGVELVRDNKEVLQKLQEISGIIRILGLFILISVSIATLVITSHLIRQGVYLNRDSIGTLKLLGAPDGFIYRPFLVNGLLTALIAGLISLVLTYFSTNYLYGQVTGSLPFIVLPNFSEHMTTLIVFTISLSVLLGIFGGMMGIKSTKPKNN